MLRLNITFPVSILFLAISVIPVLACEPDEITSRLVKSQTFEFVQEKHIPALSRPLISRGRIFMNENEELIWELQSPVVSRLVISPNGISQYNGKGELTMNNTNEQFAEISSLFLGIFNGNLDILKTKFAITASCSADQNWTLTLIPDNESLAAILTQLQISGADTLEIVTYEEKRGDLTTIHLTPVSDSTHTDSLE
jgi:hypothetical protein